jgi:hypothetical protein
MIMENMILLSNLWINYLNAEIDDRLVKQLLITYFFLLINFTIYLANFAFKFIK